MAASLHGDTPYSGKAVTSGSATPYTTSVDVNDHDAPRLTLVITAAHRPDRLLAPHRAGSADCRHLSPNPRDEKPVTGLARYQARTQLVTLPAVLLRRR